MNAAPRGYGLLTLLLVLIAAILVLPDAAAAATGEYTLLQPAMPTVVAAAESWPGGSYRPENILRPISPRGNRAEYASRSLGAETFIDFDFGKPTSVRAVRHLQRATIDVVAESTLIFSERPDFSGDVRRVVVKHRAEPGAMTFVGFPAESARYVRWQVTRLAPGASPNVGGQFLEFLAEAGAASEPSGIEIDVRQSDIVPRGDEAERTRLQITLRSPYAEPIEAEIRLDDRSVAKQTLTFGENVVAAERPVGDAGPQDATVAVVV
ncbi:MAG: hypothetical protein KDA61_17785, partial [Planctomycetales bacterium]|nr:hypothetical protein [Planctomycetales bacterium]